MRIWSLHPSHLDRMGLVACWRETLLAQAVLAGRTRGYTRHPQLERFRAVDDPLAAVGAYLTGVAAEATARGYRFDASRIIASGTAPGLIPVTSGQLDLEWRHLGGKLVERDPERASIWRASTATPHPLFRIIPGGVESWERATEPLGADPLAADPRRSRR